MHLTAVTAFAVLLPGLALAQPIDSFKIGASPASGEYTVGNLLGQNPSIIGWSGGWQDQFQGDRFKVVDTGLSYSTVPVAGGAVETLADQNGRVYRNLSNPIDNSTNRTFYMSFMMQAVGAENAGQITYSSLEFHNGNGQGDGDRQLQIGVGENLDSVSQSPNYFVSLFNSDAGQFAADLGVNDGLTNFFVAKFELSDVDNADTFTLYRNPEDLAVEANSTIDFSATGFNISLNSTAFGRFGAAGTLTYDELRQGGTYESVTSVVPGFVLGDTNGDFVVEFEPDFGPIRDNWLETNATFGMTLERLDGDLNLNGVVSIEDFREWKNAYLQNGGTASQVAAAFASLGASAAPEPSSLLLVLAAGVVGFAGRRRSVA
jgi:hypothetical protein